MNTASPIDRGLPALAAAVLLAAYAAVLATHDVSGAEIAKFAAFELGLVLLPGYLLYVALTGRAAFGLREVVGGAALGYVLEIGLFALTAALDLRAVLPVAMAGAGLLSLPFAEAAWRERRPAVPGRATPATWLAIAVAVLAVVTVTSDYYASEPLPSQGAKESTNPDIAFEVALAAEAKHHFPPETPTLAGRALHYHYFASFSEAAAADVTEISQPVVTMRLALVPLLLLSIGGMFLLGREVSGSLAVGVIAAILMLFAGAPDPLPGTHGLFFRNLSHSDTFLLGLSLFLPLLAELTVKLRRASAGEEEPNPTGTWAVILLLLAGCAGAKGTILPVLIGGLVISLAFALWRDRISVPPLRTALIMAGALLVAALAFIYGSSGGAIKVVAFGPGRLTEQYVDFVRTLPGWVPEKPTLAFFGGIVANSKMLAPLVPGILVLLLTWRWRSLDPGALVALLAGISVTAVACFNMLSAVGEAQNYFLFYGYASLGVLSALGLSRIRLLDRSPPGTVAAAAALCAVVLALAAISDQPFSSELHLRKYGGGTATLAPDIEAGLDWIRRNTPTDTVLAVSNQYDDRGHREARDCVYPAFAERRVLLSCDYGSGEVYPALGDLRKGEEKHPYPERFALNEAIFRGDRAALRRAMAKYGVDYLVVDRLHAFGDMSLSPIEELGRTVYANRHLLVIQPYR